MTKFALFNSFYSRASSCLKAAKNFLEEINVYPSQNQ